MRYHLDDMTMTTSVSVPHPTAALWQGVKGMTHLVFVLLVLRWSWTVSAGRFPHAFFTLILGGAVLYAIYQLNKI